VASASRAAKAAAALAAVLAVALIAIPVAIAAFGSRTANEGDIVTAAPDFVAPAITAATLGKVQGGVAGRVHKGGGYYVYANVSADTGNPASGISTVKANVAGFTSGATEVAMTAGTYTAGGTSYNYRSAELIDALQTGTERFTITAKDVAGNTRTVEGSAIADSVVPTATDIQTTNVAGGTVGLAEQGDTVVFTFSEPIDPISVQAAWTGASTPVVVRMVDNGLLGLATGNDAVQIYNAANSTVLPLGTIDMGRGDYVAGLLGGTITFGATGTASTMVMSGNTITVTLGTYTGGGIVYGRTTAGGVGAMVWTPVATPFDWAGNLQSVTPATQSGTPRKNF
jgi:hypothetical protein